MNKSGKYLVWTVLSVMGAFALGYIALNRGEQINALWIVVASVCIYLIAYRFYGLYIAKNVLAVDPTRMTPAVRHNDGLDYVPTDKKVLFGHHFAAIAGAGPLVGPVLAAQMGYLPGMIWILAGVVLAGAVNLDVIAVVSKNEDGFIRIKSYGFDSQFVVDLSDLTPHENEFGSSDGLIRGVAAGIAKEGGRVGGFDAYFTSDVLQGSGLSSSAAFDQ